MDPVATAHVRAYSLLCIAVAAYMGLHVAAYMTEETPPIATGKRHHVGGEKGQLFFPFSPFKRTTLKGCFFCPVSSGKNFTDIKIHKCSPVLGGVRDRESRSNTTEYERIG